MSSNTIVGVDIGGTNISIGIVRDGQVIEKNRIATPALEAKQVVIDTVIQGIAELSGNYDIVGIGVGVPGLLDERAGIVYDLVNIPSWDEVHLADAISEYFKVNVFLTNDANSYVVGEKLYGMGSSYRSIAGVTLGTGLGVGFIFNDQLHSGIMSCAGELGAMPYLHHNYEHYCSGKFFVNEFGLSGSEVYSRAIEGDAVAKGIFLQYGIHIGHLVKHLLHVVGPEAVFFGGSIKESFPFFEASMWEVLDTFPYRRILNNLVIKKSHMDDVAILGAAAVYEMNGVNSEEVMVKAEL